MHPNTVCAIGIVWLMTLIIGFAETVRMDHIKDQGYYQGEITPIGPDIDFDAPHNRDQLSSEEPAVQT